jgi:uncharacterized protein (DUF983 family)
MSLIPDGGCTLSQPGTHKGFNLRCPFCGEEGRITIDAYDLAKVFCVSCATEIERREIDAIFGRWQRLFAWLETAPDYPGD